MQVAPKLAIQSFLREEVMGMSKEELVVKLYDIGISSCLAKDRDKVSAVIAGLIDSLNFDHGEIPARLFRLYQYAMGQAKIGNFGESLNILQELRTTWIETFKLEEKHQTQDIGTKTEDIRPETEDQQIESNA